MKHLLIALLLWMTVALAAADAENKRTTALGAILPLTGPLASVGRDMRHGIELGAAESLHRSFEVTYEDDQSVDRMIAVSAAKKLADAQKVEVIFNTGASTASAIAPALKQAKTPLIIVWDSNREVATLGDYVFGFGYANELAGESMADFASRELKKRTVAVIALHDDWSELIAESFVQGFKKNGGAVVLHEIVDGNTTDFRSVITKVRARRAEALYIPLYGPALLSAIKQARELKYDGVILTADALFEHDLKAIGSTAEGVYLSQIWLDSPTFRERFQSKFGAVETSAVNLGYVALGYDAVKMLDSLASKLAAEGKPFDKETIARSLPGFSFTGVLGPTHISATRTTDRREKILVVRDGRFQIAEPSPTQETP